MGELGGQVKQRKEGERVRRGGGGGGEKRRGRKQKRR